MDTENLDKTRANTLKEDMVMCVRGVIIFSAIGTGICQIVSACSKKTVSIEIPPVKLTIEPMEK